MLLHDLLTSTLELFFTRRCVLCHRPLRTGILCHSCTIPTPLAVTSTHCIHCASMGISLDSEQRCYLCRLLPSSITYTRFLWHYEGLVKEALAVAKYRPSRILVEHLSALAVIALPQLFPSAEWEAIVPMPTSRASFMQREFNQCVLLGAQLSHSLRIPLVPALSLAHRRRQASLPLSQRMSNATRALSTRKRSLIAGRRVLLVDDVATTGASSTIAALHLLHCGAAQVDLFTLARSHHWNEFRSAVSNTFERVERQLRSR